MRSDELDLGRYDTDKIPNGYLPYYDRAFSGLLGRELVLLEIGLDKGGSLALWRDYFPGATIAGVDRRLPQIDLGERVQLFRGSQDDTPFLTDVAQKAAPDGFDVIIDDASHIAAPTRVCFWHLFDHHLKPGGLYVLEDWGTGYWDDWPDGRTVRGPGRLRRLAGKLARRFDWKVPAPCHAFGLVGFVKELVDEQGAADVTRGLQSSRPLRGSKFESMTVTPSVVFVTKAGEDRGDSA